MTDFSASASYSCATSFFVYQVRKLSSLRLIYQTQFSFVSSSQYLQNLSTAPTFRSFKVDSFSLKGILSHSVLTDFIKVSLMNYFFWMNVMVERTSMDSSVASLNPFWLPYEMSTNFKTLACNHWSSMSESLNLSFNSAILLKTRPARYSHYQEETSTQVFQLLSFKFQNWNTEAQLYTVTTVAQEQPEF